MATKRRFHDFIIQLFLWCAIVVTCVHEYGHLLAARLVGMEGAIYSFNLDAMMWVNIPSESSHLLWFVYLGGGLFAAIVFSIAYLWCDDWELRFCFLFNASFNAAYMIGEMLSRSTEMLLSAVLSACFAFFMLYMFMLREN